MHHTFFVTAERDGRKEKIVPLYFGVEIVQST